MASADERIRIATFNIRFLSTNVTNDRLLKLKNVLSMLDADVIGLQEIDDREALSLLFSSEEWHMLAIT